ncbi:tetratricopeptide repeat protein [Streptomyces sp. NPDC050400]|uniref:tetratricopeptide repeat protein n=1 Tax=Streptomyces sp. NPDC050400 TaxID=3365610 RepID=UPI0037B66DA0
MKILTMFSRRNRRPKTPELLQAWQALDEGDIPGALRQLRQGTDDLPLDELALVVARAAGSAGFDDLRTAADALSGHSDRAQALYDFGYACIERGVPYLAIPALRAALRQAPDAAGIRRELVSAYERLGRHREAVDLLTTHEDGLVDWPDRYLLVFNAVMAGDLDLARRHHARLSDPQDAMWLPAQSRQRAMLERAAQAGPVSPLDATDLRGWQYVIGGSVLTSLSPYGFDAGMTGRFAWLQDTHAQCLRGLVRLKAVLDAAEVHATSVSLLPDRGSRILGLAAARLLELPAKPFAPDRENTVIVAYDLNEVADAEHGSTILRQLLERTPGQILHEHASNWVDPPVVAADSIALLHQAATAPWEGQLRADEDGDMKRDAPDSRPEKEIAADILAADATPDEGDGMTPADPVEHLTDFVSAVRNTWLQGNRSGLSSAGPVSSSRFL